MGASVLIFAASLALSVGGFGFHAMASRALGVSTYGTLYALISLAGVAGLPVSVFTPVVAKYAAEFSALHDDAHVRGFAQWLLKAFAIVALAYVAASVLCAVPLAAFFHVRAWQIPFVGIMIAIGILSSTLRSIGQGTHAYGAFALSLSTEGVVKVAALVAVVIVGASLAGVLSAYLLGLLCGACAIAVPLFVRYRNTVPKPVLLDWRRIFATTGAAAVLTVTMMCMGFADVLLVKHYFAPYNSGLYAAASLCGKILLYFVGFVPTVLIPQATHRHARGERTRKVLWVALAFIGAVALLGIIAYGLLGTYVLHILMGTKYDAAAPLLIPYSGAMAALAMTNGLASYGLSTHRLSYTLPLLACNVLTIGAIALNHPTLAIVADELMIGNLAAAAVVGISLALQSRMKPA